MARVLITGTSGFIGHALAQSMAGKHDVIAMSRRATDVPGITAIQGDFTSPDDLAGLDRYEIDVLIHLAAVTGLDKEEEQLSVNVLGTRRLLRRLIDRGCRKFVLASSIAAAGVLCDDFRPQRLPLPDDHPCLDSQGYGFSKYLMEELARYMSRQDAGLDLIAIRLSGIIPDDAARTYRTAQPPFDWGMSSISPMYLSDAVRCFAMAAEAPLKPGFRLMNATGPQACVVDTIPEIMRARYGEDAAGLDLSYYERPGHERDPVFDIRRIRAEIGFTPERKVRDT
ncbi:MAG: NAD(P)-dependent oxidoreductase [Armatimonadetes bacterium]|nr:NAD(P)-dependent oxidoreductase [Armatimonadota bacterium]